jgi:hypothetical protein
VTVFVMNSLAHGVQIKDVKDPAPANSRLNGRCGMTEPVKKSLARQTAVPQAWLGYIAIKVIVLALVIYVALKYKGLA